MAAGCALEEEMPPLLVHDVCEGAEQIAMRIAVHMELLKFNAPEGADIAAIHSRHALVTRIDDVGEAVIERGRDTLIALKPQDLEVLARLHQAGDRLA